MTREILRGLVATQDVAEAIRLYSVLKGRALAKKLIKSGDVFVPQEAIDKLKTDQQARSVIRLASQTEK